MILTTGSVIVYPSQGPCLIEAIVERTIGEQSRSFYQLLVLSDGGGNLFVPVEKIEAVGIRLLLNISEIPKLMDHLTHPAPAADHHRQRSLNNLKLMASGSAFDLAQIVGSLTELRDTRSLGFSEFKSLEKAKGLLACEIAEVMGTTKEAATEQVEKVLGARTKKAGDEPAAKKRVTSRNQTKYQSAWG